MSPASQAHEASVQEWLKQRSRPELDRLKRSCIQKALVEQGLWELAAELERIVPDVSEQYSTFAIDTDLLKLKVRGQQAFQCALASEAIHRAAATRQSVTVVDIGDSAGTHILYLQRLLSGTPLKCLSVNLDQRAVEKIRGRGLDALLCRAEDLTRHGVTADVFLSFEMLEHLSDPVGFLRDLSYHTSCEALAITVPYVAHSRVGLHQVRRDAPGPYGPETTHIFELSPADWDLLVRHAGWRIASARVYYQYPRRHWLRVMQPLWRLTDFEGFWGAILVRDHTWSDRYDSGSGDAG